MKKKVISGFRSTIAATLATVLIFSSTVQTSAEPLQSGHSRQRQSVSTVSQQTPDDQISRTSSTVSEDGGSQINDPTTDNSATAFGTSSTSNQNGHTSSTSATTKESNVVLPTSSIGFNTALAGLLISDNAILDKEMAAKSSEQVPTKSGIWVPIPERNDILNLLNAASAYPFTIDQNGYIHKVRDSILDSQKSLTFYNKIDALISGQNRTILSISSCYWSYNESSHTIVKQTISDSVSVVFQNSRILILDRAHFVPKSQNEYPTIAIALLNALYKDGSDYTLDVSKELSSLSGQVSSSSSDSTVPPSSNATSSQDHSDSSSNSSQTQSSASSENSSSSKKDTGDNGNNSKTSGSSKASSSTANYSSQTSSSVNSTPQASGKPESASSFNFVSSSARENSMQDEQNDETSSNTVSSSKSADIEKDSSPKTNIASTVSADSGSVSSSSKVSSNSDTSASAAPGNSSTNSSSNYLSSTVSSQSKSSQLPSQSSSASNNSSGRANNSSSTVSTSTSNVISNTDSSHSDISETSSDTQAQSRTFDVALAGLLEGKKHSLSRTDVDGIVKNVPTSNGIWIPTAARKTMLNLINSLSSKPFEIDTQGYLKLKANETEDQTKSALFAEKLLSLINGQECIILSPTTEIWYDGNGGPAPSPSGFGDAYSVQIQGKTGRLVLLNGSLFKTYGTPASNVTVSSLLVDQLLEDGTSYSTLINKELSGKSSKSMLSAFSINIAAGGTMTSAQT